MNILEGDSVANCWIAALNKITAHTGKEISPVILKINNTAGKDTKEKDLEADIDNFLSRNGESSIEATAGTIFPQSLDSGGLSVFDRYENIWKYVKKDHLNRRGTYFRRLTSYGEKKNQLAHIIKTFNGTDERSSIHRRSALIATTFDPMLDHKSTPLLGFPCLQQVCFIPVNSSKTLSMNAIYAMQYIDRRGYGNYIGLMRLGKFMAREMGLNFTHINCMISVLAISKNMTKAEARVLVEKYA